MKRKFYNRKEMSEIKHDADIVNSSIKRNKLNSYVTHWNTSDMVHTFAQKRKEELILLKQNKKPTKRIKGTTNIHFCGKVI